VPATVKGADTTYTRALVTWRTHSVGLLDEDALFYLQARGLPPDQARDLLLHAFAGEVLGEISSEELRGRLEASLFARLDRDLGHQAPQATA